RSTEPAVGPADEELLDAKEKIFSAMHSLQRDVLVRGQFDGYRKEDGVAPDSDVEAYAAVRLFIDSWRWGGVPFYVRAGKNLPIACTEVMVQFHRPPQVKLAGLTLSHARNYVRFRLSPEVGTAIRARSAPRGDA